MPVARDKFETVAVTHARDAYARVSMFLERVSSASHGRTHGGRRRRATARDSVSFSGRSAFLCLCVCLFVMVRPIVPTPTRNLCEECQRRASVTAAVNYSRHVPQTSELASGPASYQLFTEAAQWRAAGALCVAAMLLHAACGMPCFCCCLLAAAARAGPVHVAMRMCLPPVHSYADFSNRHFRVTQSLLLVSVCSGIYTLLPDPGGFKGWKMNLVTMETSMASGIAATYGYSVAGGVPGGLLAEFVIPHIGRQAVSELSPYLPPPLAKCLTSFGLFLVMGSYMECVVIIAYAFAHRAEVKRAVDAIGNPAEAPAATGPSTSAADGKQSTSLPGHRRSVSADDPAPPPAAASATPTSWRSPASATSSSPWRSPGAETAVPERPLPSSLHLRASASGAEPASPSRAAVKALPDFSDSLPADYRKGYGDWRTGRSRGAKGEPFGGARSWVRPKEHEE